MISLTGLAFSHTSMRLILSLRSPLRELDVGYSGSGVPFGVIYILPPPRITFNETGGNITTLDISNNNFSLKPKEFFSIRLNNLDWKNSCENQLTQWLHYYRKKWLGFASVGSWIDSRLTDPLQHIDHLGACQTELLLHTSMSTLVTSWVAMSTHPCLRALKGRSESLYQLRLTEWA